MQTKREKKLQRRAEKQGRREMRLADRTNRPTKQAGEVFMTGRATYHDHWCSAMNGVWLSGSNRIKAIDKDAPIVGSAELCLLCKKIAADAIEAFRMDMRDARYE